MPNAKVRVGLIGAGGMGRGHLKTFRNIQEGEIVGVADPSPHSLELVRKDFSVPVFATVAELLDATRLDGCIIASPHPLHLDNARQCLKRGVHVFTEKPMTSRVGEADAMIAAAKKARRILAVMFQARTEGRARRARELIASGALGEIRRVTMLFSGLRTQAYYNTRPWRGTWAGEGGGVLLNQAPHPLDRAIFLCGMPSRVVAARCDGLGHTIETEDWADAMVEYPNGARGYFFATTAEAPAMNRLEISGDRGRLVVDDKLDKILFGRLNGSCPEFLASAPGEWASLQATWEEIDTTLKPGEESGHIACLRDFCQAIRDRRPPMITGEDGRQSMELANAFMLSAANGGPVKIPLGRKEYERFFSFACEHGRGRRLQQLVGLWRRQGSTGTRRTARRKISKKK